jgi:2'-5' RNA ligase
LKADQSFMQNHPPLVVTAALDEGAFAWFDDLRQIHFPPDRNRVPAHLTLFHALPGEHEQRVAETLKAACQACGPMRLDVRGPWFIGRGVAYRLASPELEHFRNNLASAFSAWLTPQDRAPFRPHITVQNKADPSDARLLLERLQLVFEPFEIMAEALLVWRYLGGPWEAVARLPFSAA